MRPLLPQDAASGGLVGLRRLAVTQQRVREALQRAQDDQKVQFDKRAVSRSYVPGQKIYLTRPHTGKQAQKLQPTWRGPYYILEKGERRQLCLVAL